MDLQDQILNSKFLTGILRGHPLRHFGCLKDESLLESSWDGVLRHGVFNIRSGPKKHALRSCVD